MLDKRVIEVEKDEAAEIIAVNTFKEIKGMKEAFRNLASAISKPNDDKAIIEAITKQGEKFDKVAAAIQNQPKPEKPEVNVSVSNQEILPLLREIKEGNDAIKKALENKPIVDEFEIKKTDNWNWKTKVIYKPANQITIKK